MASLLAAGMQIATWLSAGMGEGVFSSRLAHTRATKHEAAHAETEAVAEDGRCCMRARCVVTEHPAGRLKSPVWSTEATYLPSSTAYSRCAGRAIRGPDLRRGVGLDRHKTWPDYENGQVKEALAGLDIRNANNGALPHYRVLYLELRLGPMSREHARPQPPAGSRRYGGGVEEPAPVPVGVTGHRTQRPSGQVTKLDPLDHTQPRPAPPWTQGANGGQYRRLWPL
jgi:hypothetical protein